MNPRCPPGYPSVLPAAKPVETTGEDLLAKDLPAAEEGLDIPPGPPTRLDKEPKVITKG